jgi:integrase/recombinase XerD
MKGIHLDQLADRFINYLVVEKGLSDNTIASYSADLTLYLDFLKANGIQNIADSDTVLVLKHLIALRDGGLGARSRARHLVTLRGFYRFLAQEKILEANPARLVDLPKIGRRLPDVLKLEDVIRLLDSPDSSKPLGSRDAAMLELLYAAGLRVSELSLWVSQMWIWRPVLSGCWARDPKSVSCPSARWPREDWMLFLPQDALPS